jgi:aspartyl-tRNA(Asn)/glutamyl-tRNA(Gln) amidotransferase subunit C
MISKKEVKHMALLARLKLSEPEIKKYQKQLGEVLDYVAQLQKLNTKNIEPCSGGTELVNVFREDEAQESKHQKDLIDQAPQKENGLIKTKKVFTDD